MEIQPSQVSKTKDCPKSIDLANSLKWLQTRLACST